MAEIENDVISTEGQAQIDEFDGWEDDVSTTDEWENDENVEDNTEDNTEETEEVEETTPEPEENSEALEELPSEEPEAYYLETKYNKELRKFNLNDEIERDTVVRLVQKGQNYDKIVNERDSLKSAQSELEFIKNALDQIKGDFATGYDLLDDALARVLVESEANNGRIINQDDAIKRVKSNRESVIANSKPTSAEDAKQNSIKQFAELYPTLDVQTIPQSVWNEFNDTYDLVGAYKAYENSVKDNDYNKLKSELDKAKAELDALKLNEKNRQRSTGSRKTSGNKLPLDPEFLGWED